MRWIRQAPARLGALALGLLASTGCAEPPPRPTVAATTASIAPAQPSSSASPLLKFAAIARCSDAPKCDDGACERACAATDGDACFALACGAVEAQNEVKYLRGACDAQHAVGCNDLGFRYDHGRGVEEDLPKARALFKQSCELGAGRGCDNFGVVASNGRGGARDLGEAATAYRRGCELGFAGACTHLGRAYDKGLGVARDAKAACAAWLRACDGDDGGGCSDLGWAFDHGAGIAEDHLHAKELFEKACDQGDARGCDNLGLILRGGLAGKRDPTLAAIVFKKACDKGEDEACARLASTVTEIKAGCDKNDRNLCRGYAILLDEGVGVTQDCGRALTLLKRACASKDEAACARAKELERMLGP